MTRPGAVVLECLGASVDYGRARVLDRVDLSVASGETVVVLGPSGSGKTTLLYAIAGFLPLSEGEIVFEGRLVSSATITEPPERRSVGVVFQHYGLWPHLDALATVAYPLRRAGVSSRTADGTARQLLDDMDVGYLADRRPAELSGGEQQRVGLARALARRPALYLFDEPTAHLDALLRSELQVLLAERARSDGTAAIHATHDVDEALALADRVVLLRRGAIVQVDTPERIYAEPADDEAALLTGPAAFIEGIVDADGTGWRFTSGPVTWSLEDPPMAGWTATQPGAGRFLVRPDWVDLGGPIGAVVTDVRYRGSHTDYRLDTAVGELRLRQRGPAGLRRGDTTSCSVRRVSRMTTHL